MENERIDRAWLVKQLGISRETINNYLDPETPDGPKRGLAIAWATVLNLDPLTFWDDEVRSEPKQKAS